MHVDGHAGQPCGFEMIGEDDIVSATDRDRSEGVPSPGPGERAGDATPLGDEMSGVPYPLDMTMPDPAAGDFEGATDARLRDRAVRDSSEVPSVVRSALDDSTGGESTADQS